MGTQKNRLIEMVLLSTHNACFGWKIRKIFFWYTLLTKWLLVSYFLQAWLFYMFLSSTDFFRSDTLAKRSNEVHGIGPLSLTVHIFKDAPYIFRAIPEKKYLEGGSVIRKVHIPTTHRIKKDMYIHTKCSIIDNEWASLTSTHVNYLNELP